MEVDTTPEEMIKNLKLNGYEHTKTKDGRDLLRKGDKTYTFYNSTGGGFAHDDVGKPSVAIMINGKPGPFKIRFPN